MQYFVNALPIWASGQENDKNTLVSFYTLIKGDLGKYIMKIAACNTYRICINNKFVASGPARACNNLFRVDEIDFTEFINWEEENEIRIDVNGYNTPTYQSLWQPAFLQAEIFRNNESTLYTAEDKGGFSATQTPFRLKKVPRYSFQRTFTEVYDLDKTGEILETRNQSSKNWIDRRVAYPSYKIFFADEFIYSIDLSVAKLARTPEYVQHEGDYVFSEEEYESNPAEIYGRYRESIDAKEYSTYNGLSGVVYSFPRELTGFLGISGNASEDFEILLCYDEVINDNYLNPFRGGTCCVIPISGDSGSFSVETFEPYSMKFVKILVLKGSVKDLKISLRTFENSEADNVKFDCEKESINLIFEAARETFKQNALDIFMDCPSRERAGWLCDSFFTARVEHVLTGSNKIERNFLENYALESNFKDIDKGMLPMCYPADHVDKNYIPNWAMWLILECEEYFERTNDKELIDLIKPKIYNVLSFFEKYENNDGLLENLDKWVFVDWSESNSCVDGVSYPSNMMYYAALMAASRIYSDCEFSVKADKVKNAINTQSYNGNFFIDNAIRDENSDLKLTQNTTEACQNYAFFTNVANPESHPELFKVFLDELGPYQIKNGYHAEVPKAQAFIGNYLRLEVLSRYGYVDELVDNMKEYMAYMAEKTGTLWELVDDNASCNHGFSSHVIYWLLKHYRHDRENLEKRLGKIKVSGVYQ